MVEPDRRRTKGHVKTNSKQKVTVHPSMMVPETNSLAAREQILGVAF
jgi:hypothetical protein